MSLTEKTKYNMVTLAYIITFVAFGSMILLMMTHNPHPECDMMLNHNNIPLATIQDQCYKYLNF